MIETLRAETENLIRSWEQHEASHLRDYLVASVEDPRLNLQSIFTRHFLVRHLFPRRFEALMDEECRFATVMNWLLSVGPALAESEVRTALFHALRQGSDNAEGTQIPGFVTETFRHLPTPADSIEVANYLESFLEGTIQPQTATGIDDTTLRTFERIWKDVLFPLVRDNAPTVLEPACGSANEYRFLNSFGLAPFLVYTGFDLCAKNIANARGLFPEVHFERGNAFEIKATDKSYDLCFLHDLLEHLSTDGMEVAVREICRVTRRSICVGFFQMYEGPEHVIRPVDEYHWNTLSMDRMRNLFAESGFRAQVIHVGTFLRQKFGCEYTHNPNAYTFVLSQ